MSDLESKIICPRCSNEVSKLELVATGMKVAFQAEGVQIPDEVCANCTQELKTEISETAQDRADVILAQEEKQATWASRLDVIKMARYNMNERNYAEALMTYKKYMGILSETFSTSIGEIIPEIIDVPEKEKEISVIASALWDMMQIYDMHPSFGKELKPTAERLKLFLPQASVKNKILKHADLFKRQANSPEVFIDLVNSGGLKKGGCYVATASFNNEPSYTVHRLREWRDQSLKQSTLGRSFVYLYYKYSPRLADFISNKPVLQSLSRHLLSTFVFVLDLIKK